MKARHQEEGSGRVVDDSGNCYAACLSTVTGVPFGEICATAEELDTMSSTDLMNRMTRLMTDRGWHRCRLFNRVPAGFAIAGGPSPRGDWDHAVVLHDGEFWHDPHPSGLFIQRIENCEIWIRILRTLEPTP